MRIFAAITARQYANFFTLGCEVLATHSTRGVFPVPPAVMLPTLITGRSSFVV